METRPDPIAAAAAAAIAESVSTVEKLLNYYFRDPTLLAEALTHSSHPSGGPTYQRLEFIGDAALTLALSNFLYLTNRDVGPGRLSSLRAANISTEKLARIAIRHDLYPLLLRNSPNLDDMVKEFAVALRQEEEEEGVHGVVPAVYGGTSVRAPKVLADVVESIIGAVYVDCDFNLEKMWMVVRGMLEPIITEENHHDQPVSVLYEICQKQGKAVEFKNWLRGNMNVTNVFVEGKLLGIGCSEQKNIAKLNAARDALPTLWAEMEQELSEKGGSTVLLPNGSSAVFLPNGDQERDGKKILNELCSKSRWNKPIYRVEEEEGPAHDKRFKCSVQVDTPYGVIVTSGDFKSRVKESENAAASKMLNALTALI